MSGADQQSPISVQRFHGRALATLGIAGLLGPALGLLFAPLFEMYSYIQASGFSEAWLTFLIGVPKVLFASYALGGPIAVVVGLILALIVWRRGSVGLALTAVTALFVPLAPLSLFGPAGLLFGLFYGIPATMAAVTLHLVSSFAAKRFFGASA